MIQHKRAIHEGVKFSCLECEYQATQKGDLTRHTQSVHERNQKYQCFFCDYQSARKDQLTNHQKSVHEGIRYECENCDYRATTKANLTQHKQLLKCFLRLVKGNKHGMLKLKLDDDFIL